MSEQDVFDIMNHSDGRFGLALTLAEARRYKEFENGRGHIVHVVKVGDDSWEDKPVKGDTMSDRTDVELNWYQKGYIDGALIAGPTPYGEGYDAGVAETGDRMVRLVQNNHFLNNMMELVKIPQEGKDYDEAMEIVVRMIRGTQ